MEDITIRDVLNVCSANIVGKVSQKGELRVQCPYYVTNSHGKIVTFDVNIGKNVFKCFHECQGCIAKGGPTALYSMLTQKTEANSQAYSELKEKLYGGHQSTAVTVPDYQKKTEAKRASAKALDRAYRAFLAQLTLEDCHRANLRERGLNDSFIETGLYKSVPNSIDAGIAIKNAENQGVSFDGVPGFYRMSDFTLANVTGNDGFFIPYFNQSGQITGMQIRFDQAKEDQPRYRWFSSAGRENGCSAVNSATFGIPGTMARYNSGQLLFVTEGGLKAAVASCLDEAHHPFIAIPGVMCYSQWEKVCSSLEQNGIRFIADAFDSDRETNIHVEEALKKLRTIASNHGICMVRVNWGTNQKGVDDYLLANTEWFDEDKVGIYLQDPRKYVPPYVKIDKGEI